MPPPSNFMARKEVSVSMFLRSSGSLSPVESQCASLLQAITSMVARVNEIGCGADSCLQPPFRHESLVVTSKPYAPWHAYGPVHSTSSATILSSKLLQTPFEEVDSHVSLVVISKFLPPLHAWSDLHTASCALTFCMREQALGPSQVSLPVTWMFADRQDSPQQLRPRQSISFACTLLIHRHALSLHRSFPVVLMSLATLHVI